MGQTLPLCLASFIRPLLTCNLPLHAAHGLCAMSESVMYSCLLTCSFVVIADAHVSLFGIWNNPLPGSMTRSRIASWLALGTPVEFCSVTTWIAVISSVVFNSLRWLLV
ncbi:uncharacterized protein EV420DRAFT_1535883 [Desarmillaria tabescens]|uniref:Uncharacterized protein n=1 Tax=Armillaria tabescens TaxID=1929756 RepID=A0AA39KFU5_ARMTA|nr:uncharacterized protein EV420DRAFT_1535883 [Desarmillaria tabescens]KAK0460257.1 hypothetical protein EV420DRAFT_1535883 [Desarmillaria tabescens]